VNYGIAAGLAAGAYLLGSVPFGFLVGRAAGGIDIRTVGSGNIGATNVGRMLGRKWGVLVLALDFLKGYLPVVAAAWAGNAVGGVEGMGEMETNTLRVCVGFSAILGHMRSVFLSFKGGKGVATSAGVFSAFNWKVVLAAFLWWALAVAATRYVSIGSISAGIALPAFYAVFEYPRAFSDGLPVFIASCFLAVMLVWTHRSNIRRLLQGMEHRVAWRK